MEEDAKRFNSYEKTLSVPITRFEDLESLRNEVDLRYTMWTSLKTWGELTQGWIDG